MKEDDEFLYLSRFAENDNKVLNISNWLRVCNKDINNKNYREHIKHFILNGVLKLKKEEIYHNRPIKLYKLDKKGFVNYVNSSERLKNRKMKDIKTRKYSAKWEFDTL